MFSLSSLASFTQLTTFKSRLCLRSLFLFIVELYSIMRTYQLVHPLNCWWTFGLVFSLGTMMNRAPVIRLIQIFVGMLMFISYSVIFLHCNMWSLWNLFLYMFGSRVQARSPTGQINKANYIFSVKLQYHLQPTSCSGVFLSFFLDSLWMFSRSQVVQVFHLLIHNSWPWKQVRRWVWHDSPGKTCLLLEGAGAHTSTWCEE